MRYASFLQKQGRIGFPAPSFGCATEPYHTAFLSALKKFEKLGYGVFPGPNAFLSEGVGISSTPEKCAVEFQAMWADVDLDTLISCGGGELMCEILDYVDFEQIRKLPPKWFMGYSDNTNLIFLLATICDIAAIYGPCAASFGMEPWHKAMEDAFDVLTGNKMTLQSYPLYEVEHLKSEENPLASIHDTEPRVHKLFLDGSFYEDARKCEIPFHIKGRLLGGCMDCLIGLVGTKYDAVQQFNNRYQEDGVIWFLEACELNVFSIRRAMWQMEHAGWFSHVKGFLIGRPGNGESIMGLDAYQAILAVAEKYHVPVIMDMDIGHVPPMMPLVVGAVAEVFGRGNDLSISFSME